MTNYPDGQEINQLSVDILYYSGLSFICTVHTYDNKNSILLQCLL